MHIRARIFNCSTLLLASWLAGCDSDAWFGDGPGATAAVTTPSGIQTGDIQITYTLTGDDPTSDVEVSYSTGGAGFREASQGTGGDGTENLSASPAGETHTFVWASHEDLDGRRESSVLLRIAPEGGTADTTQAIKVNNGRFLAAVERGSTGRLRLYSLDAMAGDMEFLQVLQTGGVDPHDVLFQGTFCFVVHQTTNDVAALTLDEAHGVLFPVAGSPFSGDGTGAKYLATDGSHLFVSNVSSGTLTVFDLDSQSGKLTLNAHSGVSAPGCQSLVVRSGRLYVASESSGSILIFDILSGGELSTNGASPVTAGGLSSPRATAVLDTRLYCANVLAGSLCGFNVQGGGDLAPIPGSPFGLSGAGVEQLARNGNKLFGVTGAGAQLISLSVDASGGVTEDLGSPSSLTGPAFGVGSVGGVVIATTTTSRRLHIWTIDGTGTISSAGSLDALAEIGRIAISE